MSTGHKGAQSELMACAWLLEHGYDVFRNVAPTGPIDLVAFDWKTKSIILIDVKSVASARPSPEQKDLGVTFLYVMPDGSCTLGKRGR